MTPNRPPTWRQTLFPIKLLALLIATLLASGAIEAEDWWGFGVSVAFLVGTLLLIIWDRQPPSRGPRSM